MTVMHVLDREPRKGEYYGIIIEEPYESDKFKYYRIEHFEKEPNGLDLVIGTIDCSNTSYFPICRNKSTFGTEVYTYGFPGTEGERKPDGFREWRLTPRYFQGYITRDLQYDQPGYRSTPSYELNFPAPSGLSGAPLLILNTTNVCGVIYGDLESNTISHYQAVEETGTKRVVTEIQKVIAFGLAHYHQSLLKMRYSRIGNKELGEWQP